MTTSSDAGWLDAQYDNRARVADHQQWFERWRVASELTASSLSCSLDLSYAEHPDCTLDLIPCGLPGAPTLIFIHGGYWRAMDKAQFRFLAPALVAGGVNLLLPNYSLCPTVRIEDIVMQLVRMVAWVWRQATSLDLDPQRLLVAGHSAGAHLAAMLMCCRWAEVEHRLPQRPLCGALALSGLYELAPLREVSFLQSDLRLTATDVSRLSPARMPAPEGPLCTLVGALESEEYLRQNQLLQQVWGRQAVPLCASLPGLHHFSVLNSLADPDGVAYRWVLQTLGLD